MGANFNSTGDTVMGLKPRETDRYARTPVVEVEDTVYVKSKKGRVKTKWIIRGNVFYSKRDAAESLGVSEDSIKRWCKGYKRDGLFVSPETGCGYEEV